MALGYLSLTGCARDQLGYLLKNLERGTVKASAEDEAVLKQAWEGLANKRLDRRLRVD